MPVIAQGASPLVQDTVLWQWDTTTSPAVPIAFPVGISSAYPSGYAPTKTGLTPADLQAYVGVPIQNYTNPPTPVASGVIQGWIRYAEDKVEQQTSILLCQTWVASPPELSFEQTQSAGLIVNNSTGAQIRGYDYDLEDAAYDFMFQRAQDSGWMFQTLRYRPVQSVTYAVSGSPATAGVTAVKNTAFIYPLLNQYFKMPSSWNVEDRDFGYIRYVPATNVQMLPLFALQLSLMGFAENVPGAIHLQYTAGLTAYDYKTRFSFMKELVLAEAAMTALAAIQGTVNLGVAGSQITVDGLQYRTEYFKNGAFGPLLLQFEKQRDRLMQMAVNLVSGPMVNYL